MIKNILFDMGQVLLRFEPAVFVARYGLNREDSTALLREVFLSPEWVMLDHGTADEETALAGMCRRLPERLHATARGLVYHWDEPRLEIPEMTDLVRELSEKGYGLYLLSNAGLRHHVYWPKLPVSQYFGDRLMVSADWRLLKPDPAFFEKALELFALDRRECLFIDDNPSNVESALSVGLNAVVFHGDPGLLRQRLREQGVEVAQ